VPVLIGELPKPRLLVLNAADECAAVIEKLAPTTLFVDTAELQAIRQKDWDGVVVFGDALALANHLYVIQFGGSWGNEIPVAGFSPGQPHQLAIVPRSNSVQFRVPDYLPTAVRPLIPSLVELITSKSQNMVMWAGMRGFSNASRPIIDIPFIEDADDYVLAGCFSRPATGAKWWWLPGDIEYPERWIGAALEDWSESDSDRFPSRPLWQKRDEWATPAELDLREKARGLREETAKLLRDMDKRELELTAQEEVEFVRTNSSDRRLLTAQGDDLVDETRACLEEFGFQVTNVDREIAIKGDRREDLRISNPDSPGWIAIAEVRGYKRGAQLNDLLRIGRFVARYVEETGRLPAASWYVVNHHFDQDPSTRPTPLASNPVEVKTFCESNGLIVDTRFLFRKRMEVRSGLTEPRDVRAMFTSGAEILSA
jgi:hypothetical protein